MPSAWGDTAGGASGVQAIRGMFKHGARGSYVAPGGSGSSASARLASVLEEGAVTAAAITAALFEDSDSVTTVSVSSDGGGSSPMRLVHAGSVASMESAAGGRAKLSPLESAKLQAAQYALYAKPGGAHVREGAPLAGMPAPQGNVLPACLETALSFDAQHIAQACSSDPLVPPSFLQSSEDGDCSSAWGLSVPLDLPQGVGSAFAALGQPFAGSHDLVARLGRGGVYRDMHRSLLCAPMLADAQPIPAGYWVPPRPASNVARGGGADRRRAARGATTPRTALCAIVHAVCDAALQTPAGIAQPPHAGGTCPTAVAHRMTLSGEIAPPWDIEGGDTVPTAHIPSAGAHVRGLSMLPRDGVLSGSRRWRSPAFEGQASLGVAYSAVQAPGKGRLLTATAQQLVRGVCSATALPAALRSTVHSAVEDPMGGVAGAEGGSLADALQRDVAAAVRAGMAVLAERLGALPSQAAAADVGRMWVVEGGNGAAVTPLSPMWMTVHVVLTRDALAHATAADSGGGCDRETARVQSAAGVGLALAVAGSLLGHTNDLLTARSGHQLAEQLWLPAVFEGCMDVLTQLLRVAHFPPELSTWLAGRQALLQAYTHFASELDEAGATSSHESAGSAGGGAADAPPPVMRRAPTMSAVPAAAPLAVSLAQRAGLRRRSMSGLHLTAPVAGMDTAPSAAGTRAPRGPDFLQWLGEHSPPLHVLATQGPRLDAHGCVQAAQVCSLHRLLSSALHDLVLLSSLPWGFCAVEEEEAASDRLQRHVRLVAWQIAARQHVADALHAPLPHLAAAPASTQDAFPDAHGRSSGLQGTTSAAWLIHSWLQCEHRSPLHLTPERQHALALLSGCFATSASLVKAGLSPLGMLGVRPEAPQRGAKQGDTAAFDAALHRTLAAVFAASAHDMPASAMPVCSLLPGRPPQRGAVSCTALGGAFLRNTVVMHPRSALHDTVSSMLALPEESDVWLAATLLSASDALSAPVLANILVTNALPGIALNGRGASTLPVPQRGMASAGVVPPLMPSLLTRSAGVAAAPIPQLADMQPTRYTGEIDYSAALADAANAAALGDSNPLGAAGAPPSTPPGAGHVRSRSMLGIHVTVVVDPAGWMTVLTAAALQAAALQLGALQRWLCLSPWVESTAQQLVLGVQGSRSGPQWRPGFDWSSIDQLQAKHDASRAEGTVPSLDSHARLRLLRRCAALLRLLNFSSQQLQPSLRGGGAAPVEGGLSASRVAAKAAEGLLMDAVRTASAAPVGGFMAILALAEPLLGASDHESFIILPSPADSLDQPFSQAHQGALVQQLTVQLGCSGGGANEGRTASVLKGALVDLLASQVFNNNLLQVHMGQEWTHLQSTDGGVLRHVRAAASQLAQSGLWGRAAVYLHGLWLHFTGMQDRTEMLNTAMRASDAWLKCGHAATAQQVLLDTALLLLGSCADSKRNIAVGVADWSLDGSRIAWPVLADSLATSTSLAELRASSCRRYPLLPGVLGAATQLLLQQLHSATPGNDDNMRMALGRVAGNGAVTGALDYVSSLQPVRVRTLDSGAVEKWGSGRAAAPSRTRSARGWSIATVNALKRKMALDSANLKHEAWGVRRAPPVQLAVTGTLPPATAVRGLVLKLALTASQLHMHGFACGLLLSGIATNAKLGTETPRPPLQLSDRGLAVSARAYLRTAAAAAQAGTQQGADMLPWMVYLAKSYLCAGRLEDACFVLCQVLPFLPLLASDEHCADGSVTSTVHGHGASTVQRAGQPYVLHRLHVFPVQASLGGVQVQCLGKATVVAVPAPPGSARARGAALLPSPLALLACRLWVRAQLASGMFEAGASSCAFLLHVLTRFHDSRCIQPVALPPPETGAAAVIRAKAAAGFLKLRGECLAAACRGRQRGVQPTLPLKELPALLQDRALCSLTWHQVATEGSLPAPSGDVDRARALLTRNSFAGDAFGTQWDVFQAAVASLNTASVLYTSFGLEAQAQDCRRGSALAQTDWALGQRQQLLPAGAGVPRCAATPPSASSGGGAESPPVTPTARRGSRDGAMEAMHGPICGIAQLYASLHVAYSWGLGPAALQTPFLQAWVPGPSVYQVDWHCRALLDAITGAGGSGMGGMWAHLAQAELHVVRGRQISGGSDLEAEAKGMAHWTEAFDMFREVFLVGLSSPVLRRFDLLMGYEVTAFLERMLRTLCLFSVDFVQQHIALFDILAACSDDVARARSCTLAPAPLVLTDALRAAAKALPSADLSRLEAAGCLQGDIRPTPAVLRDSGAWEGLRLARTSLPALGSDSGSGTSEPLESKVSGYTSAGHVYRAQLSPAFMRILEPPCVATVTLSVALDNTPGVQVPPLDCADVHSTAAVGNAGRVLAASTLQAFGLSPGHPAQASRALSMLGRLLGAPAQSEGPPNNPDLPAPPASADGGITTGRSSQVSEGSTATTPDPPGFSLSRRSSRASSAARLPSAIHEGRLPSGECDPAGTEQVPDSPVPDAASSVVGDLLDNRSYLAKLAGSSYRYAQFAAADGRQGTGIPKAQMTPAQRLRANREKYSTYPPRGARLGARRSKLSATLAGQRLRGGKADAGATSARASPLQRSETGTSVASLDSSHLALEAQGGDGGGDTAPASTASNGPLPSAASLLKAFRLAPVSPLVAHGGGRGAVGRVASGAAGSGTAQLLGVALSVARNLASANEGGGRQQGMSELSTHIASSIVYRRVAGDVAGGGPTSHLFGDVASLTALHRRMPAQQYITEISGGHAVGAVVNEWLGCSWPCPAGAVRQSAVLHALRAQYPVSALGMPSAPWGALLAAAEATGGTHNTSALQRSILCVIMQRSGTHIVYTPFCSSGPAVSQVAQAPGRLMGTPPFAAEAWNHDFHAESMPRQTVSLAARVRSVRLNAPVSASMSQPAGRGDGWRYLGTVDEYIQSMLHAQSWLALPHKVRGSKAVQTWCAEIARRLQWGVLSSPTVDLKRLAVQLQASGQVAGRKTSTSKHKRKRTFLSWVKSDVVKSLPAPAPPINIVAPGAARLLPWENVFQVGLKESLKPSSKQSGPIVEGTAAALAQQQDDELRPLRVDVGDVAFVRARSLLALAHRAAFDATSASVVLPVALAKGGKPLASRAAAETHAFEQLRRDAVLQDGAWTAEKALVCQLPLDDVCNIGDSFSAISGHSAAMVGEARLNYVSAFGKVPSDTPQLTATLQLQLLPGDSHVRQAGVFNSPLSFVSMIWGNIRSIVHSSTRVIDAQRLQHALRQSWRADAGGLLVLQHADFAEASESFTRALAQPWLPILCLPNAEGQYREALAVVEAVLEAFSKTNPPSHTPDLLSALQYAAEQASVRVGCSCILFV